ncbi:hypothetical protein BDN71DRAFT_1431410 [Pleurotus eryngii]|uniref:Uncharacterized protein n=1 Tax=Pleurotus eryngii TaxID=5323 RepID=A0A9P5ZW17_PLEER|nr:hypothetical protein BDN71DRAFT_1431410 [Pleurotus eryngii]
MSNVAPAASFIYFSCTVDSFSTLTAGSENYCILTTDCCSVLGSILAGGSGYVDHRGFGGKTRGARTYGLQLQLLAAPPTLLCALYFRVGPAQVPGVRVKARMMEENHSEVVQGQVQKKELIFELRYSRTNMYEVCNPRGLSSCMYLWPKSMPIVHMIVPLVVPKGPSGYASNI